MARVVTSGTPPLKSTLELLTQNQKERRIPEDNDHLSNHKHTKQFSLMDANSW